MARQSDFQEQSKAGKSAKHLVNDQIKAPEVRVIGADGAQHGLLRIREALQLAEDAGLDLVEVAPDSKPPVCRLIDYGKLRYKEQKKAAEARKKSSVHVVKELRVRYSTDKHDIETKVRNARRFLGEGDKVRFDMRFKGREAVYESLGRETYRQIIEMLSDIAVVEEQTPLLGQRMLLLLAPKGGAKA